MTGPTLCTPCDLSEQGAPRTVWANGVAPPGGTCKVEQLLPSRGVHVRRDCPTKQLCWQGVQCQCAAHSLTHRQRVGAADSRYSRRAAAHFVAGEGASSRM